MTLYWLFCLLPTGLMLLYFSVATLESLRVRRSLGRQLQSITATLAELEAELAALECLTPDDRAWLAHYDAMTNQAWPLPTVGSFWEWNLGVPMSREVVEVTGAQFAPPTVRIKGASGEREVSLDEFNQNAIPAPLKGHNR